MQTDARLFFFFSCCRNNISAISVKKFEKPSRNKLSFEAKITNASENYSTKSSQSAPDAPNDNDKVELGSTSSGRRSKQVFLSSCCF